MAALVFCGMSWAETVVVEGRGAAGNPGGIQAAIDEAASGDTVVVPAGTYAVRKTVALKSGVHVKGAGQGETVLVFEGESAMAMVSMSGCEDAALSHLTLDGQSNPLARQGISAGNARRLSIHDVTVKDLVKGEGFGPHGILFAGVNPTRERGVTDSVIADCRIENVGVGAEFGGGIRLSWGSSRNRVLRNRVVATGRGGIFGDNGSTDLVIRGNTVKGSGGEGLGIEVWGGCDRCVIEDNTMDHWLSIGGCDYCAARRNTISEKSGAYKFCGIEGIGSYLVITDNTVDGGQKIGLSVSAPMAKEYVYWGGNTVRDCNQWGAQFQGEKGGIAYHYLYQCTFVGMPLGKGEVWYPGDEGHGFRMNGNNRFMVFEGCSFRGNGRCGIQCVGQGIDALSFVGCTISGNKAEAIRGPGEYSALEWIDCTVKGNRRDTLPEAKAFASPPPSASFDAAEAGVAGEPVAFANTSAVVSGGIEGVLWDFGDGVPGTEPEMVHVYRAPGAYRVTLIVWDEHGRAGRAARDITISAAR